MLINMFKKDSSIRQTNRDYSDAIKYKLIYWFKYLKSNWCNQRININKDVKADKVKHSDKI